MISNSLKAYLQVRKRRLGVASVVRSGVVTHVQSLAAGWLCERRL